MPDVRRVGMNLPDLWGIVIMIIDEDDGLFYLDSLRMSICHRALHWGTLPRHGLHSRFHIF